MTTYEVPFCTILVTVDVFLFETVLAPLAPKRHSLQWQRKEGWVWGGEALASADAAHARAGWFQVCMGRACSLSMIALEPRQQVIEAWHSQRR